MIVSCGITDKGVTSLSGLLSKQIDMRDVAEVVTNQFAEIFQHDIRALDDGWHN